jgi:hypothetical protein
MPSQVCSSQEVKFTVDAAFFIWPVVAIDSVFVKVGIYPKV